MENKLSTGDQFLTIIKQIIEDNIDNENFSVEDLAKDAGLSRSMLHRKLIKLTGKSASDLITEIRLTRAIELLENDAATVAEVAYRVGFNSPSYFNRVFKKNFQISPGDVKRRVVVNLSHTQISQKPKILKSARFKNNKFLIKLVVIMLTTAIAVGGAYYLFTIAGSSEKSVAILPLRNLTGQPENDFIVDGIHEGLNGELGKIGSLRVISTTSTNQFRNPDMFLLDIAEKLEVDYIVEGSIIAASDSLQMSIQLYEVIPKERQILAKEYHGDMHHVLSIQKSVVEEIAQKIRIKLSKDEEQLFVNSYAIDPETFKAYLRGMSYINQGTDKSIRTGMDYLAKVIDRDRLDPSAYAGYALGSAIGGHGMIAPQESFRIAEEAAKQALRIDQTNNKAHTALALLYLHQYWDLPRAKEAFEKAIANTPNNEIAHSHYAWYYAISENMEKSIYHAKLAVEIDPLSALHQANLAWIYYDNGEYDQAEFWARKSLENPGSVHYGNLVLGWVYLKNKQFKEAIETHERLPNNTPRWIFFRCRTYVLTGEREKAVSVWDKLNEIKESSEEQFVNPFYLGMIAGILGKSDRAFELLNEAYDKHYFPLTYIDVFPSAEFIRNDPRYNKLLQKLNLPESYSK